MKKLIYLVSLIALTFSACDKISEADYLQSGGNTVDTTKVIRKVLLEDFTGHQCGNCPEAAEIAHELQELHGKNLIVMSVHAGFFARVNSAFPSDYRTPEGNNLETVFKVSAAGNPNGMVNREGFGSLQQVKAKDTWGTLVSQFLVLPAQAKLEIATSYVPATREVSVEVDTKFLSTYPNAVNVVAYITEDSIVSVQVDDRKPSGQQNVVDYVHRHVLRGALNTAFGEELSKAPIAADYANKRTIKGNLAANWKEAKCSLVVALIDVVTQEVIQVEEQKIIR